jgi:hypothetical protein
MPGATDEPLPTVHEHTYTQLEQIRIETRSSWRAYYQHAAGRARPCVAHTQREHEVRSHRRPTVAG